MKDAIASHLMPKLDHKQNGGFQMGAHKDGRGWRFLSLVLFLFLNKKKKEMTPGTPGRTSDD